MNLGCSKALKLLWWTRGVNTHHTTLLESLRARGVDVEVCYYHGHYGTYRLQMGWRDRDLRPWEHYISTIREARRTIKDFDERIQLVSGYSDGINWKVIGWALLHRGKWFAMCEGPSGSWKSMLVFRLFAFAVERYSVGVFPLGRQVADRFRQRGVCEEKIVPFQYATMKCPERLRRNAQTESSNCTFVFAGEFCRRKGVDILAKAWQRIHDHYPGARLVVAGGNVAKDVDMSFLAGDGVEYVGAVRQEEIYSVISRGTVMILPSRYDPWGAALVEGAAAGLAMIGSDKTGAALELIKDGTNGCLVKAGDVDSLVAAMSYYAACPELAIQHGLAARSAALVTSGENLAQRMIGFFERRVCV